MSLRHRAVLASTVIAALEFTRDVRARLQQNEVLAVVLIGRVLTLVTR